MSASPNFPGKFLLKKYRPTRGETAAQLPTASFEADPGSQPAPGSDAAPWNSDPFPEPRTIPTGWDLSELAS
ncbi:MAG: hypothetical protein GYA59_10690 [Chloroflexi bacterium]|nr:hypothetical protein [Chloroflexota bacterium]